jgi:phosphoribosyl 1,2-cyclic phosphodiesterase
VKLTFLGTRGAIPARSRRHRRHASALVEYRGARVMIDAGEDWLGRLGEVGPEAIVLTHAHPDHAFGLREGAPCPVHASDAAWQAIGAFGIERRERVRPRARFEIGKIGFEFFQVEHSTRAPAGGYRIEAGRSTIFYVPDVVSIHDRAAALAGIGLYVGDAATLRRSMVRRTDDGLVGHTPLRTQLGWCQNEGVPRALFTHCGSGIVEGDERTLGPEVRRMGKARGVTAAIAHDGQEVVLR